MIALNTFMTTLGVTLGSGLLVASLVVGWAVSTGGDVHAAAGTPVPTKPDACLVEPRPLPLFASIDSASLLAAATPANATPAAGEPASPETVAAITAVTTESLACRNAGDLARVYALFSDAMLVHLFGDEAGIPDEVSIMLAGPAHNEPKANRLELVAIEEVVLLPDGRARAMVETRDAEHTYRDVLFFTNQNGQWLIDDAEAGPVLPR